MGSQTTQSSINSLVETVQTFLQHSTAVPYLRNLLLLVAVLWGGYRFLLSDRGRAVREMFPFLRQFAIHREARELRRKGEHALAGELYLEQRMWEAAIECFMAGHLFGRAADVYLQRNMKEKAATLYEKAGQHEKAAQLYIERRAFDRAEANLMKVGREEEMAQLYEKIGSKKLAADSFAKMGRIKDAVRVLTEDGAFIDAAKLLKGCYENKEMLFSREVGYPDRKAVAQAAAEFFVRGKDPLAAAKIALAEHFYKQAGDAFIAAEEYDQALAAYLQGECFMEAAALQRQLGKSAEAATLEAEGLIRQGKEEEAARAYIKSGDYARAGDVYRNLGQYQKAGEMYEKGKEYRLAGSMFGEAKDFERAGGMFERGKQYEDAIEMFGKGGHFARQVALLEKLEQYVAAAENYFQRDLYDEAMQMLEKIGSDHQDYAKACAVAGRVLLAKGELSAAKAKLEEALSDVKEISKENVAAILDLAHASEKLGEKSQALFAIERMLAEDFVGGAVKGPAKSSVKPNSLGGAKQDDDRTDPHFADVKRKLGVLLTGLSRGTAASGGGFAGSAQLPTARGGAVEGTLGNVTSSRRYVPIKEIGRGGMGVVYTARDQVLDRVVALKVLPSSLQKNKQAVATFMREAKSAASLNHKNIVIVHDAGVQDGEYYIAMELIDGMTIKEIIKKNKRLALNSLFVVLKQLLEGLRYAHQRKIVHRDLTTNNIMWSREKAVKIMDFGLAKVVRDLQSEQSIIGGTPSYMSPEQTIGNPVDHRTDLYSLGVCLYEMGTGELPFRKGNLAYHHVHTAPPDPSTVNPELPDALTALILKCMQKEPEKRPQSVDEVWQRLAKELAAVAG